MKAIETEYRGYKFRSRLEARWAVFFDACGVKWEYEPEGFDLGDGIYYLPDFLLHNVYFKYADEDCKGEDLYVEVKGQMTEADAKKIHIFSINEPILVVGSIPDGDSWWDICQNITDINSQDMYFPAVYYDFITIMDDCWTAYPGVDSNGHFVLFGGNLASIGHADDDATTKAYRLARQARFEHGENPSQNLSAKPIYLFPSLNGIAIDILSVNGMSQYFVKAARIFSAITGKDEAISVNHPLIQAAEAIGVTWFRFITQRLSGGNSYGRKGFYFAVDDVPQILLQYVEHNYRPKTQRQELYNQEALKLCKWFISIVIPQYGKNTTKI